MTLYRMLLAPSTLSIAVILGLGFSNGGQGGEPYWPVVAVGLVLLMCTLVVLARCRPVPLAWPKSIEEDPAYCRPCRKVLMGKGGKHCGERGPDCAYGCACPCPIDRRDR